MKWWVFGLAVVVASRISAEPRPLVLDGGASQLGFEAKTTFHDFSGRASKISGELMLEHERPVQGRIVCSAPSLLTGVDGRDRDMWSAKYLNAARFPDITFTLESLEGPPLPASGDAHGTLTGALQVRDSVVPVTVPVTYGWSGDNLIVSGSFSYDIRKAGMTPPVVALIQKMDPTVRIRFVLRFKERR